jgi:ribosomal protein S18 acetylase RimI-like enzyme
VPWANHIPISAYVKPGEIREQKAGLSRVWIAIDTQPRNAEASITGYLTLSPLSVPVSPAVLTNLGLESVPYRSVGGYLLGRLGVAAHLQGQGLGPALVAAAIKIARQARDEAGGAFMAVDPKNDGLLEWYEELDFGFRKLDPGNSAKRRLVLRL